MDYTTSVSNDVSSLIVSTIRESNLSSKSISGNNTLIEGGDTTITIIVTAQDGVSTNTYSIIVTRAPSSDATLSALTLSDSNDQNLQFDTFSSNITAYNYGVPHSVEQIIPSPITSHAGATFSISGHDTELTEGGISTIIITVTAQDGVTTEAYTIDVSRGPDDDSKLDSLVLNDNNGHNVTFSPAFNPDTLNYTASVVNSITTITPVVSHDNGATTDVSTSDLTEGGDTVVTITVTAQDGVSTSTYSITVTRAPSSDATLGSLTLLDSNNQVVPLNTGFTSNVTSYMASVVNAIYSSSITALPVHNDATTDSGTYNLTEGGDTTIELTVTAQDGVTTKVYTIIVTRAPSSDATLSSISFTDPLININGFSSSTISYNLSVPNPVQQITPSPVTSNTNATVNITGHTNELTEGGDTTITITVTAQDGVTTKVYTIIVTRAPSSDATLSSISFTDPLININGFSSSTTSYNLSVPHSTQQITPSPVTSNTNATVNITGHIDELIVNIGTAITITVTAQDGVTTKVYTIIVTRAPSSDATLSALTLLDSDNQNIQFNAFSSNIIAYNLSVPHSTQQITPSPVTSHADATTNITGHTNELTEGGVSTITITVTAQDGITTKIYTIDIYRGS